MWVMTVTTNQFIFTNGVSGGLKGLGTYILMAAIAYFGLIFAFQHLAGFVNKMAVYAGHVLGFMIAGKPTQKVFVALMAFQADAILSFQG